MDYKRPRVSIFDLMLHYVKRILFSQRDLTEEENKDLARMMQRYSMYKYGYGMYGEGDSELAADAVPQPEISTSSSSNER